MIHSHLVQCNRYADIGVGYILFHYCYFRLKYFYSFTLILNSFMQSFDAVFCCHCFFKFFKLCIGVFLILRHLDGLSITTRAKLTYLLPHHLTSDNIKSHQRHQTRLYQNTSDHLTSDHSRPHQCTSGQIVPNHIRSSHIPYHSPH